MGFHNTDSNSDGAVDAAVNTSTVTTQDLFDLADGGEWETLNDMGFEQGDLVTLQTYSTRSTRTASTTSSSYVAAPGVNEFTITDTELPTQMHYRVTYRAHPRGDQIDVRMFNATDNEVLPGTTESVTGTSWQMFRTGTQSYSPTTTTTPVLIHPQIRNSDGSTSVDLEIAQVEMGDVL